MTTEQIQKPKECGYNGLYTSIIIQAALDYRVLCNKGVTSVKTSNEGNYSKGEITRFFRSKWCDCLLKEIGCHIDGNEIERLLKEYENSYKHHKTQLAAYSPDGNLIKTFKTLSDGAEFANLNSSADICKCCKGVRKTAGGYIWKYI